MQEQAETERQEARQKFEAEQNQFNRESNERVAEIRASVNTATQDLNANEQSDYIDTLEYLDKKNAKQVDQSLARTREINAQVNNQQKNALKNKELQVRENIAQKQLQVAAINKNKYDKK